MIASAMVRGNKSAGDRIMRSSARPGLTEASMQRDDGDGERRLFDLTTRSLHWLTAGLIALVFVMVFSVDAVASKVTSAILLQLHRSFGITVWVVTIGRLIWRQFAKFPAWPADMPRWMRLAAHGSEYALYALLLSQPILGLLYTNASGDRVDLFLLGQLPAVIHQDHRLDGQLLEIHETVGQLLLALIALHVLGALFHHYWRRDDTLAAMLPLMATRRKFRRDPPECT
jgi:cytochrome b561